MKVDFMIVGAQKCGTTTLFDILDGHPAIEGCRGKEPHFFSTSRDWKKDLHKYHRLFNDKEKDVLHFEASTTYTFYPLRNLRIWSDIYDYNPNMKFIYLVRNPIDRIISHYMHSYERGYTDLSIEEVLIKSRQYIDITRYYTQIRPYIEQFGRDNVKIIDFEDFIDQRKNVIEEISNFIGVDDSAFADYEQVRSNVSVGGSKRHHKFDSPPLPLRLVERFMPSIWNKIADNSERTFSGKPVLSSELQEMIVNVLELEIKELGRLMKKDLGKWMLIQK